MAPRRGCCAIMASHRHPAKFATWTWPRGDSARRKTNTVTTSRPLAFSSSWTRYKWREVWTKRKERRTICYDTFLTPIRWRCFRFSAGSRNITMTRKTCRVTCHPISRSTSDKRNTPTDWIPCGCHVLVKILLTLRTWALFNTFHAVVSLDTTSPSQIPLDTLVPS